MLLTLALAASLAQQAAAAAAYAAPADYVPQRVFDTRRGAFIDFESMVAALAQADVVLVGEQHDDPNTHRLEYALVSGLRRRRVAPTVSLEMFERDVQDVIDRYLSGAITEEQLLKEARPWPRYATDYRPLVELAKTRGLAGGRRKRAAALRVRDRQDGRSRASASCPRPTGRWWPGISSARTMPTSTGSRAR